MNLTRNIKSVITNRKELLDRNRNNYLILELDNGESIFVFSGKVNPKKWPWLKEGQAISFIVEAGKQGRLCDWNLMKVKQSLINEQRIKEIEEELLMIRV